MAKPTASDGYTGTRLIDTGGPITAADAGKLLQLSNRITMTLDAWQPLQWVDLQNVGQDPVTIEAPGGDGINRTEVSSFTLAPDQLTRVVFMGLPPPSWAADYQPAQRFDANAVSTVSDAGDGLEGRLDMLSVGLDLVLEGDAAAGTWRAPWPGVLDSVAGIARAGTASLQARKTHEGATAPAQGFTAPVGLTDAIEGLFQSGETFAEGDRLDVMVTDYAGLLEDADGLKGVLISLQVTRTGP